jgi:hypothetical protein
MKCESKGRERREEGSEVVGVSDLATSSPIREWTLAPDRVNEISSRRRRLNKQKAVMDSPSAIGPKGLVLLTLVYSVQHPTPAVADKDTDLCAHVATLLCYTKALASILLLVR